MTKPNSPLDRILCAVDIVQQVCGYKHPESRELADELYKELTQQLLMKNNPDQISLKINPKNLQPSKEVVLDTMIHPCLVKKMTNVLELP